ncbi:MAG: ABC transporter ATP-binding protein [Dehalococcoidales bacterium]|nr:ABC transporter ATP-binding protein [Dehalococcoidales bacterium]
MLEVKDLCVQAGTFFLKNIDLEVRDGEYFVLLGPTGSGKSVLLESIAGLNSVTSGEVWINGRNVTSLNLAERKIGFAFQDYALYRHLSVRDNISFGLMWKNMKQKEINKAVDAAIDLLGVSNLLDKHSWTLSGGESQKIALARAIAIRPDLLILDEPLSAVDAHTSEDYERELKEVHRRLDLTTIHVTHSFEEAVALGDRIAVIMNGEIVQVGGPEDIFLRPQSEKLARFLMTKNVLTGDVIQRPDGTRLLLVDKINLSVNTKLEGKVKATVRPENIVITREPVEKPGYNSLSGKVTRITDRGTITQVTVDVPPDFSCLVLRRTLRELALKENDSVYINFETSDVNVFRQDDL